MNERILKLNNKYREILSRVLNNKNVDTYIFDLCYHSAIQDFLTKSKENKIKQVAINYKMLPEYKDGLKKDFKVQILDIDDVIELVITQEEKDVLLYIKSISNYEKFKN